MHTTHKHNPFISSSFQALFNTIPKSSTLYQTFWIGMNLQILFFHLFSEFLIQSEEKERHFCLFFFLSLKNQIDRYKLVCVHRCYTPVCFIYSLKKHDKCLHSSAQNVDIQMNTLVKDLFIRFFVSKLIKLKTVKARERVTLKNYVLVN